MTEHRDIIDIRLPDRLTRERHDPAWGDVAMILGIFAGGMLGLVLLSVCGR